jgi:hypothetical protein
MSTAADPKGTSASKSAPSGRGYAVELDGRLCVYVPAQRHVVLLNESATRVWQLIHNGYGADGIAAALSDEFNIPPERLAKDVEAALNSFHDVGLDLSR